MWKRLLRLLIAVPPVWILVLNQLLLPSPFGTALSQVGLAFGHSDAIVKCKGNIKYSKAVKVGVDEILATNGLYAEHYDTNGDGKFDIITLSHTDLADKRHRVNPVFWIVDKDYDGIPDAIYIDKKGLGKCTDIVLYQDLNKYSGDVDNGLIEDNSVDHGRRI
jgi:hypothetical protein